MTGSAAFADVNAQEVWNDWKAYMTGFGYEMTASEATAGPTLTVSDITMSLTLPEDAGTMAINMGEMTFTNQSDGTVAVGLPASQPITINVSPTGEDPVNVTLDYVTDGFNMVVSGSANDMAYAYSAASVGVKLKELVAEGETVPIGAADMAIRDLNGSSTMKLGNLREIAQSMKAGAFTYNLDFANPDNAEEVLKLNGALGLLTFDGTVTVPLGGYDMSNMASMLKAGFSVLGTYGYTGGNMNFQFVEGSDNVQGATSSESGNFEIEMSNDTLKYVVGAKGQKLSMAGGDIPFPIEAAFGETLFKLIMPVSKSDETQDFALGITLRDFSTSEMLWGLVDPQGTLPHDPATIAFDISGKGKLGFDLMDPAQMEALESGEMQGMPGEVESLAINNIEVSAAGASLTGKGSFVFDFPRALMSQGMQGTDGALDLRLSGANGLAQKLVEMGLVPQDQVMGMQMMMGMFAVPAGDDVYESKIEIKSDGQILANGQRLQ